MTERRRFIATAGGAMAAAAAAAIVDAPNVIAQPKVQWRMSTAWTPALDMLQGAAQRLAKVVEEMSGGRFRIEVFPGGQIMPPFDCFDAASKGTIEAFMALASLLDGEGARDRVVRDHSVRHEPRGHGRLVLPGRRAQALGGDLRRLQPRAAPRPGVRPADGRMVPEEDQHDRRLQGAQDAHRPGLGGKVYARAGGTTVLTPAAEIYAALERGVIDAAEWVGPHDDMKLGLHKTARYYYYPGWHEPGTMHEFGFNKKAYEALPVDLRRTLDHAAAAVQVYGLTDYHAKNAIALERLKTEFKGKVEVLQLPAPVLRDLKKLSAEVVREESEKTPMARKVHASFTKFQALVGPWDHVAEGAYHQFVAG